MKNNRELENILDDCLQRLAEGESVEQCLKRYPEQTSQLGPLLGVAQAVGEASAIQPRPEFRSRARYEFRAALKVGGKRAPLRFRPRWVIALMTASILLLVGGGTAVAASNSMPDEPLYSVKLATERMQLAFTPSDIGKVKLSAMLADRRVAEIICMADKGDIWRVEITTRRLGRHLTALTQMVSTQQISEPSKALTVPAPKDKEDTGVVPEEALTKGPAALSPGKVKKAKGFIKAGDRIRLRVMLYTYATNDPAALRAALDRVPAPVKPALRRAIGVSVAGYRRTLAALD
ncbi:MAG: hypothetical protein J7K77_04880 [Dehalococcoidales bacterium]|nr:hypothetical protein [Dehalococcoidales bacterium]